MLLGRVLLTALLASTLLPSADADAKSKPRRVTLDVKDAEIRNVLRFLAELGDLNLVVAEEVTGKVTLHLTNVPFDAALQAVLMPKGLGMESRGAVSYVDTLERINKRGELLLAMREHQQKSAPLRTLLIPVSYASAESLLPLVKSMLSDRGRAAVDARTNTLIVTDVDPESIRDKLL